VLSQQSVWCIALLIPVPHDHPSLLVQVKLDRKIKRILLSSKGEAYMTELRNEHLLKSARGSKSYFIGHNGFWIMRQSRLRTSG
jgi:hypothetical protein